MNIISELEKELVVALLVETKPVEKINSEHAIALIARVKSVLQSNLISEKVKEAMLLSNRTVNPYSY